MMQRSSHWPIRSAHSTPLQCIDEWHTLIKATAQLELQKTWTVLGFSHRRGLLHDGGASLDKRNLVLRCCQFILTSPVRGASAGFLLRPHQAQEPDHTRIPP
jgi:hypothetical protein